jgi:protein TonB
MDDYPKKALALGMEGKVRVRLAVGVNGRPTACEVVQSSGHKELDDATCNIMMRRALFKPARDENGKPTVDTFLSPPIEWKIRSLEPRRR